MSVHVYNYGLVCASVCAPKDMPVEEVEHEATAQHPTGLAHGWKKSDDDTFSGGEPNPCECNSDSERRHWLLNC